MRLLLLVDLGYDTVNLALKESLLRALPKEATTCSALEVRESNSFTDLTVHSKKFDFPVSLLSLLIFIPRGVRSS